jgi:hypothetical protein
LCHCYTCACEDTPRDEESWIVGVSLGLVVVLSSLQNKCAPVCGALLKEISFENIFILFFGGLIFCCANKKEKHDFNKNRGANKR